MGIEVISVRDPVWANKEHTLIDCIVEFSHVRGAMPFTASPHDVERHGQEIFYRCISGEFGTIKSYYPPLNEAQSETSFTSPPWIERWPELHDFLEEANLENARGTLRGIGLVWGSMLETKFKEYVYSCLNKKGISWKDIKRKNNKSFGNTFADYIEGAKVSGMILPNLARNLDAIRKIRNVCAHQWRLSFNNPQVRDLADDFENLRIDYFPGFKKSDDFDLLMRLVYSSACCSIIISLATEMTQG